MSESTISSTIHGIPDLEVDAFSPSTFDQFEVEVARLLARDRLADDPAGTSSLIRLLIEREGIESRAASTILADTGVRQRWNDAFATARAERIAGWLRDWLRPPGRVVDLFAGDCLLTGRLAEVADKPITAVERTEHYHHIVEHPMVELLEYAAVADGSVRLSADVVLLVAVLHHEMNPAYVREVALGTGASRFVVVENCVDDHNGPEFHLLMDLFFNRCLNEFGSACTREHRAVDQWSEFLAGFGELVFLDEMTPVPGLPFPYQLMVFEQ